MAFALPRKRKGEKTSSSKLRATWGQPGEKQRQFFARINLEAPWLNFLWNRAPRP